MCAIGICNHAETVQRGVEFGKVPRSTNPTSRREIGFVDDHRGARIRTGDLLLPKQFVQFMSFINLLNLRAVLGIGVVGSGARLGPLS